MDLISQIVERAKSNKQRIVLPEGTEERTLKAANQVLTDGVADLILLGNPSEIMDLARETFPAQPSSIRRTTPSKRNMLSCFASSARKKA